HAETHNGDGCTLFPQRRGRLRIITKIVISRRLAWFPRILSYTHMAVDASGPSVIKGCSEQRLTLLNRITLIIYRL
ncbi:hypothetical protein STEG23_030706, partial [Scotinomys teguina]